MTSWESVFVVVFANGIVVFLFQQWIQLRLRRISESINRKTVYGTKTFDLLAQAYKKIWEALIDLEDFVRRVIVPAARSGDLSIDWTEVMTIHTFVRKEMLVLPDKLKQPTESFFSEFEEDINNFLEIGRQAIARRAERQLTAEEETRLLRTYKESFLKLNVTTKIESLRGEYNECARTLLIHAVDR